MLIFFSLFETFYILSIVLFNLSIYIFHRNKLKMITNICHYIGNYNIIYLKVIQSISINSHLFDKDIQQFLVKYTDNVPYSRHDINYTSLNNLSLYSNLEINYTPINSGIFALVFKGFKNDKPIAIKILKNNIKTKLISCINTLDIIFYILSYIPNIKNLNLKELLDNNKEKLIAQTDCKNEINNMKLFYNFYKDFEQIIIPCVYEEFTDDYNNLLVMDYITGDTITKINSKYYKEYGEILLTMYFSEFGLHNIHHGDLHVGNILFLEENNIKKIAILDFGLIYTINECYQNLFFTLLKEVSFEKNYSWIYDNIHELTNSNTITLEKLSEIEKKNFKNELIEISKYTFETKFDLVYLTITVNRILNNYKLKGKPEILELLFTYGFAFNTLEYLIPGNHMFIFIERFNKMIKLIEIDI